MPSSSTRRRPPVCCSCTTDRRARGTGASNSSSLLCVGHAAAACEHDARAGLRDRLRDPAGGDLGRRPVDAAQQHHVRLAAAQQVHELQTDLVDSGARAGDDAAGQHTVGTGQDTEHPGAGTTRLARVTGVEAADQLLAAVHDRGRDRAAPRATRGSPSSSASGSRRPSAGWPPRRPRGHRRRSAAFVWVCVAAVDVCWYSFSAASRLRGQCRQLRARSGSPRDTAALRAAQLVLQCGSRQCRGSSPSSRGSPAPSPGGRSPRTRPPRWPHAPRSSGVAAEVSTRISGDASSPVARTDLTSVNPAPSCLLQVPVEARRLEREDHRALLLRQVDGAAGLVEQVLLSGR